jgi:hypothetical protein
VGDLSRGVEGVGESGGQVVQGLMTVTGHGYPPFQAWSVS